MRFVDTHCHLYLPDFKADLDDVMRRAADAGVERFYLPAIESTVIDDLLRIEQACDDGPASLLCQRKLQVRITAGTRMVKQTFIRFHWGNRAGFLLGYKFQASTI